MFVPILFTFWQTRLMVQTLGTRQLITHKDGTGQLSTDPHVICCRLFSDIWHDPQTKRNSWLCLAWQQRETTVPHGACWQPNWLNKLNWNSLRKGFFFSAQNCSSVCLGEQRRSIFFKTIFCDEQTPPLPHPLLCFLPCQLNFFVRERNCCNVFVLWESGRRVDNLARVNNGRSQWFRHEEQR